MKEKVAFCFDLDGTVTQEELLPLIAKEADLFEEINILTKITLDGLIPFGKSFKLRVKLLASAPISVVKKIVDEVRLDPNITEFIRSNKSHCYIVTGNLDVWIAELIANELGCGFFSSQATYEGDTLHGIKKVLNKRDAIISLREQYDKIVTIGDSMNDCSMFEVADTRIAYGGVHQPTDSLIQLSDYVVYHSSSLVELLKQNIPYED